MLSDSGRPDDRARVGDERLLQRVMGVALTDPEVRRLDEAVQAVRTEHDELRVAVGRSPLAGKRYFRAVLGRLSAQAEGLVYGAGEAIERKIRSEARAVRTLVAQALRVKVETAKAEESRLQASLKRRDQRPKRVAKTPINWADDEKLVWPFEGEYWRDELGTYELTLARSCR